MDLDEVIKDDEMYLEKRVEVSNTNMDDPHIETVLNTSPNNKILPQITRIKDDSFLVNFLSIGDYFLEVNGETPSQENLKTLLSISTTNNIQILTPHPALVLWDTITKWDSVETNNRPCKSGTGSVFPETAYGSRFGWWDYNKTIKAKEKYINVQKMLKETNLEQHHQDFLDIFTDENTPDAINYIVLKVIDKMPYDENLWKLLSYFKSSVASIGLLVKKKIEHNNKYVSDKANIIMEKLKKFVNDNLISVDGQYNDNSIVALRQINRQRMLYEEFIGDDKIKKIVNNIIKDANNPEKVLDNNLVIEALPLHRKMLDNEELMEPVFDMLNNPQLKAEAIKYILEEEGKHHPNFFKTKLEERGLSLNEITKQHSIRIRQSGASKRRKSKKSKKVRKSKKTKRRKTKRRRKSIKRR